MTAGNELFISYSQHDGDIAATLVDLLQSAGVACFLAEKSMGLGVEWEAELRNAILRAQYVLVLLTPNSRVSPWVAAETGAAWVLGKPVFPVLRGVRQSELDGPIKKYQSRQVGTRPQIDSLVEEIASLCGRRRSSGKPASASTECFNTADAWGHLLKVGDWSFDTRTGDIRGEGMYRYLLSSAVYGATPCRIDCRLRFESLDPEDGINAVNAGILFGWSVPGAARKYVSVTLSGESVFVEKIGFRGYDEYFDFEHVTDEVALELRVDESYEFSLVVNRGDLVFVCNDVTILRASLGERAVGRVGLRPWRSKVVCERFEVRALAGNED